MGINKKKVLVFGINSHPELTGIGKYTGEMVDWLLEEGHSVTLVTSFPYYPYWKIQKPYNGNFYRKEVSNNGNLITYRCPLYVPAQPTGLKRQLHEASFFLSSFVMTLIILFKKKHDFSISVAPPFFIGFLGLFYKFIKGTPVVYHIQDLQIDAAKELGILKRKWIFNILFKLENFILVNADIVATISEGMENKVKSKVQRDVMLMPNWVDTDTFHPSSNIPQIKEKWGFLTRTRIVLYSGSIGEKQGLETLIQIAKDLRVHEDIVIIICGIGPFKEKLESLAQEAELSNLLFFPLQEISVFNEFMNIADVHLVLQKGHAGDLVMPSKLTTILSVGGLALVTAWPQTSLHEVLTKNKIGVAINPDDECLLKKTIIQCCFNDYSIERVNARRYAVSNLNKEVILAKLIDTIDYYHNRFPAFGHGILPMIPRYTLRHKSTLISRFQSPAAPQRYFQDAWGLVRGKQPKSSKAHRSGSTETHKNKGEIVMP
jgi:colanic acid biosynthesis glycosyl transferase WcaI